MKSLYFFTLLFLTPSIYAQNKFDSSFDYNKNRVERDIIFTKTEIPVSYRQGEKELIRFIDSRLNIQTLSYNKAVKGNYKVIIRFIVKKDGSAYDFIPETSNNYKIEEEIIRILKSVPKWKPAMQNNHIVTAYYKLHYSLNL